VQWGNIHISPVESDKYNLFSVMMMLIFDALLYGVLTWYIENIHPGRLHYSCCSRSSINNPSIVFLLVIDQLKLLHDGEPTESLDVANMQLESVM